MFRAPKIAKPCPARWSTMKGDDQVRHCGSCDRQVFNLSNMTEADGKALMRKHTGKMCVRYYLRSDGTVMTKDCGLAERAKVKLKAAFVGACSMFGVFLGMPVAAQGARISPESELRYSLKKVRSLTEEIRVEKDPETRELLIEMRRDASKRAREAARMLMEKES